MAKPLNDDKLDGLPMMGGTVQVSFKDRDDLEKQYTNLMRDNQGMFLVSRSAPPAFAEFDLLLRLPDGSQSEAIHARLVQVIPREEGHGLMLQLLRVPDSLFPKIERILAAGNLKPPNAPEPIHEGPTDDGAKEDENQETSQNNSRLTLYDKLRSMQPNERARHAQRANKLERSLLMRDTEPMVTLFLLKNPQILLQEVVEIARMPAINHQSVQLILNNKQWVASEEVRFNLTMNPKCPLPTCLKILKTLNMKHLRELAKNHNIKSQLKKAALRIVLERNGVIR